MTELQRMQQGAVEETIQRLSAMHAITPTLRHDLRIELQRLAERTYVVTDDLTSPLVDPSDRLSDDEKAGLR